LAFQPGGAGTRGKERELERGRRRGSWNKGVEEGSGIRKGEWRSI